MIHCSAGQLGDESLVICCHGRSKRERKQWRIRLNLVELVGLTGIIGAHGRCHLCKLKYPLMLAQVVSLLLAHHHGVPDLAGFVWHLSCVELRPAAGAALPFTFDNVLVL